MKLIWESCFIFEIDLSIKWGHLPMEPSRKRDRFQVSMCSTLKTWGGDCSSVQSDLNNLWRRNTKSKRCQIWVNKIYSKESLDKKTYHVFVEMWKPPVIPMVRTYGAVKHRCPKKTSMPKEKGGRWRGHVGKNMDLRQVVSIIFNFFV